MSFSAVVSRALSVFVFVGSVAAASQAAPAATASIKSIHIHPERIALTGPRPSKGSDVDPCGQIGNCVAKIG